MTTPIKYVRGGVKVRIDEPASVELLPRIVRVRLVGFLFESAKTFLLPQATSGITELVQIYQDHPNAQVLVSGHTDTVGPADYNRGLSMERAEAIAAYLTDDVAAWMDWYHGRKPNSDRWGAHEDALMFGKLGYATLADYQKAKGVGQNGQPDDATRQALIKDYMSLDGTTLPATCGKPVTHGCGMWHLAVPTGPNVDKQENRRVEVFFFEGGITPPAQALCPWNGCPEYPQWVQGTQATIDVDDAPDTLTAWVKDDRGQPVAGATVHCDGRPDATTGADGRAHYPNVPAGKYTLRAEKDGFESEAVTADKPAGSLAVDLVLPDAELLVYRQDDDPQTAKSEITASENAPLNLMWRIRGEASKVELGNVKRAITSEVTWRTVELGEIDVGLVPVEPHAEHTDNGDAVYELTVTRKDGSSAKHRATIHLTLTQPPGSDTVAFLAEAIDRAEELGLLRRVKVSLPAASATPRLNFQIPSGDQPIDGWTPSGSGVWGRDEDKKAYLDRRKRFLPASPHVIDFDAVDNHMASDPGGKMAEAMVRCHYIGRSNEIPHGRNGAYRDVIAPFDNESGARSSYASAAAGSGASSCGLFIRAIWQLLGTGVHDSSNKEVNRNFASEEWGRSVLAIIGAYGNDCGATHGSFVDADYPPHYVNGVLAGAIKTGTAGGVQLGDPDQWKPGDCVYIVNDVNTGFQHIFTIVSQTSKPAAGTAPTLKAWTFNVVQGGVPQQELDKKRSPAIHGGDDPVLGVSTSNTQVSVGPANRLGVMTSQGIWRYVTYWVEAAKLNFSLSPALVPKKGAQHPNKPDALNDARPMIGGLMNASRMWPGVSTSRRIIFCGTEGNRARVLLWDRASGDSDLWRVDTDLIGSNLDFVAGKPTPPCVEKITSRQFSFWKASNNVEVAFCSNDFALGVAAVDQPTNDNPTVARIYKQDRSATVDKDPFPTADDPAGSGWVDFATGDRMTFIDGGRTPRVLVLRPSSGRYQVWPFVTKTPYLDFFVFPDQTKGPMVEGTWPELNGAQPDGIVHLGGPDSVLFDWKKDGSWRLHKFDLAKRKQDNPLTKIDEGTVGFAPDEVGFLGNNHLLFLKASGEFQVFFFETKT